MEFSEVVRRRRMIRHYSDKPLAPEVVERILASALRAPSAGFSQGWAFLALTDPADRARFWPFVPTRVEATGLDLAHTRGTQSRQPRLFVATSFWCCLSASVSTRHSAKMPRPHRCQWCLLRLRT